MAKDQLALVQTLAERQEKEAGARLSTARDAVDQSQRQLAQVLEYRKDYYLIATGASDENVDTNRLRAARRFLSDIDDIIGRQQQSLLQAERVLEQHQTAWVASKRRVNSIKNLRQKRRQEADQVLEKQAQKLLDDVFAAQTLFQPMTASTERGVL